MPLINLLKKVVNLLKLIWCVCKSFKSKAFICRFNGLWPQSEDLHQWIYSSWTKNCEIILCSKAFFAVQFYSQEDYKIIFQEGTWFQGRVGIFITPWFLEFDPSTMVVTKMPIWVRLPNMPLPFWHPSVLQEIGNSLGIFFKYDRHITHHGLFTCPYLCGDWSKKRPSRPNVVEAWKLQYTSKVWIMNIQFLGVGIVIKQNAFKKLVLKQEVNLKKKGATLQI